MTINLDGDAFHVEVLRSAQRRRTVQLKYVAGTFVLCVPDKCPETFIRNFLEEKQEWMQRTRTKLRQQQNHRRISPGSRITTEFYALYVELDTKLVYPKYRVVRNSINNSATFYLAAAFFSAENQEKLYANLEKYLLTQMMKFGSKQLIARAEYWAHHHSIEVKELFVRVQKSRLGYCTYDNRIMLNGRLLFAPGRLRDYVICHELAHTRHKNHSKQYWAYLEKLFPGAKAADKLLRDTAVYSMQTPQPAQPHDGQRGAKANTRKARETSDSPSPCHGELSGSLANGVGG